MTDPSLLALRRFITAIDKVDERARHAAICYLADKYLGVTTLYRIPLVSLDPTTDRGGKLRRSDVEAL